MNFSSQKKSILAASVLQIATGVVAIGVVVMLITVSVVTGFKQEIYRKIIGFQSHISITHRDINESYEQSPVDVKQKFYKNISGKSWCKHIQTFATKAGIAKNKTEVSGLILKGLSKDFDPEFLSQNLIKGKLPRVDKAQKTQEILISRKIAELMNYDLGDKLDIYFIQDPPKVRRFSVSGIYSTGMEEMDKIFAFCDIRHIQKINDWGNEKVGGFEILTDDFSKIETYTQEVEDELASDITPLGTMLQAGNFMRDNPMTVQWLQLIDANVILILMLMIIVAVLSMIAALLVIILERTSMIGTLKSIGASNRTIVRIFLYNGLFLILKGMLWGNCIAFALLLLQKYFHFIPLNPSAYYVSEVPVHFDFVHILVLNICTLCINLLFLILPALAVAKVDAAKTVKFK